MSLLSEYSTPTVYFPEHGTDVIFLEWSSLGLKLMNYTDKIYGKFVHMTCYANLRKNSFCQIKLSLSACTA